MLVLHAIWSSDCHLCIWGEDSSLLSKLSDKADKAVTKANKLSGKADKKDNGKTNGKARLKLHPFCADRDWLCESINSISESFLAENFLDTEINLLLPTLEQSNQPLASPHLLYTDINSTEKAMIAPWRVKSVCVKSIHAIDLLLALSNTIPTGIVLATSTKYFIEWAKFALELVTRGRAMPGLDKRKDDYYACWNAIIDEDRDLERWQTLVKAMPASCRAELMPGDKEKHNGRMATEIAQDLMQHLTDGCIRSILAHNAERSFSKTKSKSKIKSKANAKLDLLWLNALQSLDAKLINTSKSEIDKLSSGLTKWRAAIAVKRDPLRLCFRLTEPPAKEDEQKQPWQLDFLLQAIDDKSLLVAADAIWQTESNEFTFLNRTLENPQEKLLESLGRAANLYPKLNNALKTAKPNGLTLKLDEAYNFLSEGLPLLEQSGFGILVPSWWRKPKAQLGLKLSVQSPNSTHNERSYLTTDQLLKYHWQISLGDEQLTLADFKKLAELKSPLVSIRGQWVELKQSDLNKALKFLTHKSEGEMGLLKAMQTGNGLLDDETGLPVLGLEMEGWLADLFYDDEQKFKLINSPKQFQGKLRPYQKRGLSWLDFHAKVGLGACLADDMGLGKTIQLLALLLSEYESINKIKAKVNTKIDDDNNDKNKIKSKSKSKKRSKNGSLDEDNNKNNKQPIIGKTLLICPMSVVGNWQREAEKFAPVLKVHVHHGAARSKGDEFNQAVIDSDLILTTYALIMRDQKFFHNIEWHRVVLDEAQNIKNSATKQTQAIMALKTNQRIALTGTPVENRLTELWSIMQFLNPGLLNTLNNFRTKFAIPIERYNNEDRAQLLKQITAPFILRRLKTDKTIIADLPDKMEMKVFCNLTREQASLYQAVVDDMLAKIDKSSGIDRRGLIFSVMMKLKQICNHPAQFLQDNSSLSGRSGKLARLEEILEEIIIANERVLCFTQFAEMGAMLQNYLQEQLGQECYFLHGGTTKKQRDKMVTTFQSGEGANIFILSLKAGGTGLNLTAANHVIHFDRWWNPAVEDQATDRAFRIGQQKNVQVRKFISIGTLEERINKMIEEKRILANKIVGTGEAWLTELSTEQLREIISLSADAIGEE